ncbi:RNA-directed DNA polymerase from mobile element jockey-like [Brachionus plicatilis]|uniref:RNA-directed DNA polymerase from mobile element jockey-like n=1 Tax=Brachionus plicatilis TaxID=10195 RepID=A0A3M7P3A5_BRAPC|nr:RNA-directed DNA polymerase from mobile element jockey-like [Brachionus plicatilis]
MNKRGEILNNLLNQNKICVINNDTPTFRKSTNVLDLALCSNDLANNIKSFKVHTNFTVSDHFPISFEIQTELTRTKIKIIDWDCFKEIIKNIQPIIDPIETIEQLEQRIEDFTETIKKALENSTTEKTAQNQQIKLPGTLLFIIKLKKRLLRKHSKFRDSQIKNLANSLDNKVKQAKLLGINLDAGLTFESHFNEIINKCSSKLNLLKILSSKHYGLKTRTLLTVMLPFHIIRKKIKKKLQIIQNKALKIIFKINRNTSNNILHAIANIDTIEQRLKALSINYLTRSTVIDEEIKEIIESYNNATNKPTKSILKILN